MVNVCNIQSAKVAILWRHFVPLIYSIGDIGIFRVIFF